MIGCPRRRVRNECFQCQSVSVYGCGNWNKEKSPPFSKIPRAAIRTTTYKSGLGLYNNVFYIALNHLFSPVCGGEHAARSLESKQNQTQGETVVEWAVTKDLREILITRIGARTTSRRRGLP